MMDPNLGTQDELTQSGDLIKNNCKKLVQLNEEQKDAIAVWLKDPSILHNKSQKDCGDINKEDILLTL